MARRLLGVVVLAALAGCATPGSTAVQIPTFSPVREALAYFPADAPLVAVVRTDSQDPGLRRVAASGALKPLDRFARRHRVFYAQLRGLLGNAGVVGRPHVGGPLLGVLETDDQDQLAVLARARVLAHQATPAGTYRGTQLYQAHGWAFGTRGRVLLVGATVPQLLDALDTRVGSGSFQAGQLTAVLPRAMPPAAFVRAYVDLKPLVGVKWRAVPLLGALDTAGLAIGATPVELRGVVRADLTGLTDGDLPSLRAVAGQRPTLPAARPALAVANLAPLAAAARNALHTALPISALKLDALEDRLRAAGVDLTPALLAGPAELVAGPLLRLQPAHPAAVARALARAARGLKTDRLTLHRDARFYVARDRGRVVLRVGFVGTALVAGNASPSALTALGQAPLTALHSPALARLPKLAGWYPRPVVLTLSGSPRSLRVAAFSGFPF